MRKILVVRFSSIGDIVLTSPVVRCMKQQLEVEIHFLTKSSFAPIMQANPYVDKVVALDTEKHRLKTLIPQLKAEDYALIVDLHHNFRTAYLKSKLKIKALTFNKINREKWWMTQFKINKLPKLHIVDRYLKTVEPIRVKNDQKGLDYFIPIQEHVVVNQVDYRLKSGHFIVFVIGAAHATKRLPTHKIKAVCMTLKSTMIVLIGGKNDREAAAAIAAQNEHIIDLTGKLSLHQSASVVNQAKLVVTHDTGYMHIAAALQRPIISIWGNTIPDFGMYPYYGKDARNQFICIENQTIDCRPCSKIGYESCPKGHFKCMEDIPNDKIIAQIKDSLNSTAKKSV